MIKTCYYNKTAVFILLIINFILATILFIILFFRWFNYSRILIYVLATLMIIFLLLQIIIFITSYGIVIFSEKGIEIKGKINKIYDWNTVKGLYYRNFFLIGEHNCVEIWIREADYAFELLDDENAKIHCNKKKYIKITKIVPSFLKEKNKFIFYETIALRHKDKLKLYE